MDILIRLWLGAIQTCLIVVFFKYNNMEQEIWKDIVWYEWLYQISSLGRVKSLDRKSKSYGNRIRNLKWKLSKLCQENIWYNSIRLYNNWINKKFNVHRLVALHFIDNPENKEQVDHINWVRNDNRLENLRWATHWENQHYKHLLWYKNNFQTNPPSLWKFWKDNKDSKIVYQYNSNQEFIKKWDSLMDIKRELWYSIWNISSVCNWNRPKANWFIWKFNLL